MSNVKVASVLTLAAIASAMCIGGCSPNSGSTGRVTQLTFESPEDAGRAVANAAATNDRAYMQQIFGPEAEQLRSGDPEEDRIERARFLRAYERRNAIVRNPDGSASLVVGDRDVVFPVPLIQTEGRWMFDTLAGLDEMQNIRVGMNELLTIRFLRALPAAQEEYKSIDRDGDGVYEYAQRVRSTPGRQDGLYWPPAPGAPTSPLGPYAASGDAGVMSETLGYNGYFFQLLTERGPGAPGAARQYMQRGDLVDGWAALAWPAIYGDTAVMSFMISEDGQLYEKDLGPNTKSATRSMKAYDPSQGWTLVAEGRN